MFLTQYSHRGGHPTVDRLVMQSGTTYTLWRGSPQESYLGGLALMAQRNLLTGPEHPPRCIAVRDRERGQEWSYGAWWRYGDRRIDGTLSDGWPALVLTTHQFADALMTIDWVGGGRWTVVVSLAVDGIASEIIDLTHGDIELGVLEQHLMKRGLPVVGGRRTTKKGSLMYETITQVDADKIADEIVGFASDLTEELLAARMRGEAAETYHVSIVGTPEGVSVLWCPDAQRIGIAWGADAAWGDATSVEEGLELWLAGELQN